ncbi:hypothetical protein Q8V93_004617 [Enterobacter asburiae]|nr:hypothetical protein [Enterobacter asburiae]
MRIRFRLPNWTLTLSQGAGLFLACETMKKIVLISLSLIVIFISYSHLKPLPTSQNAVDEERDRVEINYCWQKYNVDSNKDNAVYLYNLCQSLSKKFTEKYKSSP